MLSIGRRVSLVIRTSPFSKPTLCTAFWGHRWRCNIHHVPVSFTAGKRSYGTSCPTFLRHKRHLIAAVWQLEFEMTAPLSVLRILYGPGGTCTNISGRSKLGNVEEDEALEMTGVKGTKKGARHGTLHALTTSFYSSSKHLNVKNKMHSVCRTMADHEAGDEDIVVHDMRNGDSEEVRVLRDRVKAEALNVLGMYRIANGNDSPSRLAFLGAQHRQGPKLVKILVQPPLQLTEEETEKLLGRRERSILAASDLFKRVVHPYGKPGDSQKGSRRHTIKGFAGARDKIIASTAKAVHAKSAKGRVQLVRTTTQEIGRTLTDYSHVLASEVSSPVERAVAAAALKRLCDTVDLVSHFNLTMRENGGDRPRHGTKSDFFRELCSQLCNDADCSSLENGRAEKFILERYPPIPHLVPNGSGMEPVEQSLIVAVDVSSFVHYPVHRELSLTIGMHAEHLERAAAESILLLSNERGLKCLQMHIGDPNLVPL